MNGVVVVWSLAAGACITLGVTYLLVWRKMPARRADLAFAVAALATACLAFCELSLMTTTNPKTFETIHRWAHVPLAVLLVALACFVRLYFQTDRTWLFWLAVGTRFLVVLVNFAVPGNINLLEVTTLDQMTFLGQPVTIIGKAVTNPWNCLAAANSLVFLVLFLDASITLWRIGDAAARRRALWIGGALALFLLLAAGHGLLVNQQVIKSPFIITLCFMGIILGMARQLGHEVSDAARLAAQLSESQEQLTMAAAAAQLDLWTWDVRRDEFWVTQEGRHMYGISVTEKITLERFLATIHPEDKQRIKDALTNAHRGAGEFQADYRVMLDGGLTRWISARGRVEFDSAGAPLLMRGVSMDNTQRSQAEERAGLLVEASPYSMIMVNDSAQIVMVNRQTETTFGYAREELQGRPIELLIPERFRHAHAALHAAFLSSPSTRRMVADHDLSGRRREGAEFPIEAGLTSIETSEGRFVLASISDISERRRLESEAREQREELAHLSRVTSLGLLSGSLAHEINQPLGIILANAQAAQRMLREANPDLAELREILEDIVGEDVRAGEAIKRLRTLLKRGKFNAVPLNLNEVVSDVLRLTRSDLIHRGTIVTTDLADDLAEVPGDSVQLQQVMINLILNACEAMQANPVPARRLHITSRMVDNSVRLSVEDQGCGLPADVADNIFKPFFTTKAHGMGIGLSISQSIIVAHHGRLWAEANAGGGSTFHMEFPPATPMT